MEGEKDDTKCKLAYQNDITSASWRIRTTLITIRFNATPIFHQTIIHALFSFWQIDVRVQKCKVFIEM